jgi:hypothetical protein
MIQVDEMHRQAMDLADEADRARRVGDEALARNRFSQAASLESDAARLTSAEPSRGILYRSAAWLALEAGDARRAEVSAARGLAGPDVHQETAAELRAVMEDARLRLSRPELPIPGQAVRLDFRISGSGVGHGDAPPEEVVNRIRLGESLLYRTAERLKRRPFRNKASPPASLRAELQPRLRVAAGSFRITFELGGRQLELFDDTAAVVSEIVAAFQAMLSEDPGELERQIPEPDYRRHFVAVAKRLGPNRDAVDKLIVTGSSTQRVSTVTLGELPQHHHSEETESDAVREVLVGELLAADGAIKQPKIKLVPLRGGAAIQVRVDAALLEDIVRPYFGRRVRLKVSTTKLPGRGPQRRLLDIEELTESDD